MRWSETMRSCPHCGGVMRLRPPVRWGARDEWYCPFCDKGGFLGRRRAHWESQHAKLLADRSGAFCAGDVW